ncbi:MAG: asparagine--tRNA ligase, partial [Deltaproteobacteria bacterium]|nr:asparagine--tRNA ligase [Deltaproteobacteria bacterium]
TIQLAEELLKHIAQTVLETNIHDLEWLSKFNEIDLTRQLKGFVTSTMNKISYEDAIKVLLESGREFDFKPFYGGDLQTEHERFLSEEYFKGPVVVFNYPKNIKAFYMYNNDDNQTVACFDVLIPKVGEVIGGSQREHRYAKLYQRILELGLDPETYKWYLELRLFGSVPHSGFGLGLERFLLFLTGLKNVRDVIPFPRYPGHAEF